MSPQYSYSVGDAIVHVYGQQPRILDNPQISFDQAISAGANPAKIAQLIVASDASRTGHKMVYQARYGEITYADGAVLSEVGSAIILQAADCAMLTLSDAVSGKVVAAHAGRPALSPEGHCPSCNVTGNALHSLLGHEGDRSAVVALVTGNICGSCFKHDRDEAGKLVEHFLRYPVDVFADRDARALDLFKVIKHHLMHEGVLEEHIRHEGPCTLETRTLSSHRRGDKTRNTFVVVKIK